MARDNLGLKFIVKGKTHYGWARLTVQALGGAFIKATLTGYAYETIPNRTILAGHTKGPEEIAKASLSALAPKPATLGLLATGALGLSIWRREERVLEGNGPPS